MNRLTRSSIENKKSANFSRGRRRPVYKFDKIICIYWTITFAFEWLLVFFLWWGHRARAQNRNRIFIDARARSASRIDTQAISNRRASPELGFSTGAALSPFHLPLTECRQLSKVFSVAEHIFLRRIIFITPIDRIPCGSSMCKQIQKYQSTSTMIAILEDSYLNPFFVGSFAVFHSFWLYYCHNIFGIAQVASLSRPLNALPICKYCFPRMLQVCIVWVSDDIELLCWLHADAIFVILHSLPFFTLLNW